VIADRSIWAGVAQSSQASTLAASVAIDMVAGSLVTSMSGSQSDASWTGDANSLQRIGGIEHGTDRQWYP
jgi:hypothetical protein